MLTFRSLTPLVVSPKYLGDSGGTQLKSGFEVNSKLEVFGSETDTRCHNKAQGS